MKGRYILILWVTLFLSGCRTIGIPINYSPPASNTVETCVVGDDLLDMEMTYWGSTDMYHVFECNIMNLSNQELLLDNALFTLDCNDGLPYETIHKPTIIQRLKEARAQEKKNAKSGLVTGILGLGISAALNSASGLNGGETALSLIEPTTYVIEDQAFRRADIKNISDEIRYVKTTGYENVIIPTSEVAVADIIFPISEITKNVTVLLKIQGHRFEMVFDREAFGY